MWHFYEGKQDVKWEITYYIKELHEFESRTGDLDPKEFFTIFGS